MPDDAGLLLALLDHQFRYLLEQAGERRLLLLPRLMRFLHSEPRVAALVSDLRAEAGDDLAQFGREDAQVRAELRVLWEAHGADLRRRLAGATEESLNAFGGGMDTYEATLQHTDTPSFLSKSEWPSTNPVLALGHWTKCVLQQPPGSEVEVPEALAEILPRLERLRDVQQHQRRRLLIAAENLAGAALARLEALAERVHPLPPSGKGDMVARLTEVVAFEHLNDFATLVHEPHRQESGHLRRHHVETEVARVAVDARLVHEELRQRVLVGQSRRALVRRYVARCEGFDARRLRELAEQDTSSAEANLTRDFARYLFDQGLTPLINTTVGGLRPDVLDLAGPNVFYVEAKQYDNPHPTSWLRAAYQQVWGTWRRLRNPLHVPEAFLLVFRRGGRAVDLPPELRYRGLRLHSMFVDLVEATVAGSHEAYPPLRLSEEDLLPTSDDDPVASS
jgi:hypothetical protein